MRTKDRYVTQEYGVNKDYYSKFDLLGHEGIDYRANFEEILSVEGGTITHAGDGGGAYGIYVKVSSPSGDWYYAHLSRVSVKVGDKISKSQAIGISGNSGNSKDAHLHLSWKAKDQKWKYDSVGKDFCNPHHYFDFLENSGNNSDILTTQNMIGRTIELKSNIKEQMTRDGFLKKEDERQNVSQCEINDTRDNQTLIIEYPDPSGNRKTAEFPMRYKGILTYFFVNPQNEQYKNILEEFKTIRDKVRMIESKVDRITSEIEDAKNELN